MNVNQTVTAADVIAAGQRTSLTSGVLADWAQKGTPKQREYLHGLLLAEHDSRRQARQHRLLKAAKLPAVKTIEGYDWTTITFPADYGREALTGLDFSTPQATSCSTATSAPSRPTVRLVRSWSGTGWQDGYRPFRPMDVARRPTGPQGVFARICPSIGVVGRYPSGPPR